MQTKEQRDDWYLKNKERINKKRNIRYTELKQNPEWIKNDREKRHNGYLKNRTKRLEYSKIRYHTVVKQNPEEMRKRWERSHNWELNQRKIVIEHYTRGGNCCEICQENDIDVLTIDHVDGGGNQHRKTIPHQHIAPYLIKNNFPEGYRILCMNCNMKEAKRNGYYGTRRFKK